VIIDEVHMVDQWSQFRQYYTMIRFLHYRLPNDTKFIGISGTLDDDTRRNVIEHTGLRRPMFLNTFIDRPEIHIELRPDASLRSSYSGLRFLFPDKLEATSATKAFEAARQLPKTMVFFDHKKDLRTALQLCRKWLEDAGLDSHGARKIVGFYHSSIHEREKESIRTAFLPAKSSTRVMLVTEAMGMGVEIAGVQLVIQYGAREILPRRSSFKTLVQRMGRAARRYGETGWFIWLLPPWFFPSPDILVQDQANY
jgi:superfamily II DNA helicase RecQ